MSTTTQTCSCGASAQSSIEGDTTSYDVLTCTGPCGEIARTERS